MRELIVAGYVGTFGPVQIITDSQELSYSCSRENTIIGINTKYCKMYSSLACEKDQCSPYYVLFNGKVGFELCLEEAIISAEIFGL